MTRAAFEQSQKRLGTILCKCCGETIDTVDTEKVHFYYMTCDRPQCKEMASGRQLDPLEE